MPPQKSRLIVQDEVYFVCAKWQPLNLGSNQGLIVKASEALQIILTMTFFPFSFGSPDDDDLLHRDRVTCGKRLFERFVKQPVLFGSSFVGLFGVHGARLMKRRPMPANSASLVFSTVRNELCQGRQELAAQKCERVGIG